MLEILKFTIPALIVLACTWIVMRQLFKNEEEKRMWELKKTSQKEISPVRLRAYERLCLLLERTQPEHLLMDVDMNGLSVQDLQKHLLRTIRLEFDHNMSQQIYVSDETWAKVMQARNEIAAFVNAMAIQLPKNSTAMDYAKILMTAYNTNGETPHEIALTALKEEARGML